MQSDQKIVNLVRSGSPEQIDQVIESLYECPEFIRRIRGRCRKALDERQMLHPDQAYYLSDAEEDVLFWIFERAFSRKTLPRTILERGGGFDPSQCRLIDWLVKQAHYQLRDWLKKHGGQFNLEQDDLDSAERMNVATEASGNASPEIQARQLKTQQRRARAKFARHLSPMRRACMLVKYIDDPDADILTPDDIDCLRGIRGLAADTEQQIREELTVLWQKVAERVAGTDPKPKKTGGNAATDDSEMIPMVGYKQLDAKANALDIKHKQQLRLLALYRQRLQAIGKSTAWLDSMEQQGRTMNLGEIKEKYANRWHDERSFMEVACRVHRLAKQLQKARDALDNQSDYPLPLPREIADVLQTTANAVSSALTRAEGAIRSLPADEPDDNPEGMQESP